MCVAGKETEDDHRRRTDEEGREHLVLIDYAFYGSNAKACTAWEAVLTVVVIVGCDTGYIRQIHGNYQS